MLTIVGSTLSLVGSGRRNIMPATNGSQRVGGCNPVLTCSPKPEPKVCEEFEKNNQFQCNSVLARMITSKSINILKCRNI